MTQPCCLGGQAMWQLWGYSRCNQSTATANTHTARSGYTNRRVRVDLAARATQLRWGRGRSPTVCCEPWVCWAEHRGAVSNDNSRGHGCSNEWVAGRVPRPRGVRSLARRARVVLVGHAGAYMTTPSSAIFWSRPRMRCPPHGDTLPNGGGDTARGPGLTCGGGALAERDASCMLLE